MRTNFVIWSYFITFKKSCNMTMHKALQLQLMWQCIEIWEVAVFRYFKSSTVVIPPVYVITLQQNKHQILLSELTRQHKYSITVVISRLSRISRKLPHCFANNIIRWSITFNKKRHYLFIFFELWRRQRSWSIK